MKTISEVEQELQNFFSPYFDCDIYYTQPDSVIFENENSFVLIDFPSGISNIVSHGKGVFLLYMYSKSIGSYHTKNIAELSEMENQFQEALKQDQKGSICILQQQAYTDYDENIKFYVNIMQLQILTK